MDIYVAVGEVREHRKIGPKFNPQVGFLERTDCICDLVDATFKARPEFAGLREMQFEGFIFHAPDTHHVVQTQEWQTTFRPEAQRLMTHPGVGPLRLAVGQGMELRAVKKFGSHAGQLGTGDDVQ